LLVVDAAQGVEAQTVANTHLALEQGLTIIPVMNKIDLPSADIPEVIRQIEEVLNISMDDCLKVSAKTGEGVGEVMEAIVRHIPPPRGTIHAPTRALVFDSTYDAYRGVITYIRIIDGSITKGDKIRLLSTGNDYEVKETGIFTPKPAAMDIMQAGDVGYLIGNIKDTSEIKIGDTVTASAGPARIRCPASNRFSRWCSAASIRSIRRTTRN
jgi:GTP-binding protein LepA